MHSCEITSPIPRVSSEMRRYIPKHAFSETYDFDDDTWAPDEKPYSDVKKLVDIEEQLKEVS